MLVSAFLVLFLTECEATLYINNSYCPSDEVIFVCSNHDGPLIRWIVDIFNGLPRVLALNSFLQPVGTFRTIFFDSISVTAELIFGNSSYYYVSTLTIIGALNATIQCNQERLKFSEAQIYLTVPEQISLTPGHQNDEVSNFTITWNLPEQNINNFAINIVPAPLHGPSGILNSTEAVEISLSNSNIEYNITMSFLICTEWINRTFSVVICPLLWNSSVIQYKLDKSGKVIALARLASWNTNQTLLIEHGNDGRWTTDICQSVNIDIINTEQAKFITETQQTEKIFVIDDRVSGGDGIPVNIFILVVISSTIGSSLLTLITVISIGLVCRNKCSQNHSKYTTTTATTHPACSFDGNSNNHFKTPPIYEEVRQDGDKIKIQISENVAYGQLM